MMSLGQLTGPDISNAPLIVGRWRMVPEWSAGGNDRYGDCTFVALCNLIDLVTAVNGAPQLVGEAEAEYFYAREAGFIASNPETDHGAVLRDVIQFWADHGWPTDPVCVPRGWCAIEKSQIHQAVWALGAVPAWCMLPLDEDAEPDFSDAALEKATAGSAAHAVLIVGSEPGTLLVVSWAQVWTISTAWWGRYGREQFGVLHPDWQLPL